jgi:hypothetical protein
VGRVLWSIRSSTASAAAMRRSALATAFECGEVIDAYLHRLYSMQPYSTV